MFSHLFKFIHRGVRRGGGDGVPLKDEEANRIDFQMAGGVWMFVARPLKVMVMKIDVITLFVVVVMFRLWVAVVIGEAAEDAGC